MMVWDMELMADKLGLKINRCKRKCFILNAGQLGQNVPDDFEEIGMGWRKRLYT